MISSYILKILKTPTKTVRTNKFSEVVGYNINIQKAAVFLYTNNELSHQKIKHNPFYRPLWWHSRQESACQCMGHGFNLCSGKILHAHLPQLLKPTCARALWATATEPVRHSYWGCVPQLLRPMCLEPVLRNRRSPCTTMQSRPCSLQREKSLHAATRPSKKTEKEWEPVVLHIIWVLFVLVLRI